MKVLLICGSPHKNSNTLTALTEVAKSLNPTHFVRQDLKG